jgi:hypothetical protein
MHARRITHRVVRRQGRGTNVAAVLHGAVASNVGERGTADARVSSSHRIVQRVRASDAFSESQEGATGRASEADASSSSQVGNTPREEGRDHE